MYLANFYLFLKTNTPATPAIDTTIEAATASIPNWIETISA